MKIAIIGSGISGLGSLYYLSKKHLVDLYEIDSRLGGHTETHSIEINNRTIKLIIGGQIYGIKHNENKSRKEGA